MDRKRVIRLVKVVLTAGYDTLFKLSPVLILLNTSLILITLGFILTFSSESLALQGGEEVRWAGKYHFF